MKILIDADACPVKKESVALAQKYGLAVLMIKNYSHEIEDDYAQVISVDQGKEVADLWIIKHTCSGDIVITQDYGLAALALAKGARAINPEGKLFTPDNIDALLMSRHFNAEMRRKHKKYSRQAKRRLEDNLNFTKALEALLNKKL